MPIFKKSRKPAFCSGFKAFAQIQTERGAFIERLITKDQQTLEASSSALNPLQNAGFLDFLKMGMMHIFTGVDHMSFMLGLVLISRRIRDLLFVVTGFTIGHSLTLALAVTGILRPHPEFIDALVAFTIAMIGAENLGDLQALGILGGTGDDDQVGAGLLAGHDLRQPLLARALDQDAGGITHV